MLPQENQLDDQVAINLETAAMDELGRQSVGPVSSPVVAAELEQDVHPRHGTSRSTNRELLKNRFVSE